MTTGPGLIMPDCDRQTRLVIEHVIAQGRDLDAVFAQNTQHRIDFIGGQDKISGDRGLAVARRLEVDRLGRTHGLRHGHAGIVHRSGAFQAHLINAAIHLAFGAKRTVDQRRVEFNRRRRRAA